MAVAVSVPVFLKVVGARGVHVRVGGPAAGIGLGGSPVSIMATGHFEVDSVSTFLWRVIVPVV